MRFCEMKHKTFHYRGRDYRIWKVDTGPGGVALFAEMDLLNALEEGGDVGCNIDDMIGYYVYPEEKIANAIAEYND